MTAQPLYVELSVGAGEERSIRRRDCAACTYNVDDVRIYMMFRVKDYRPMAAGKEEVLRAILVDMKNNRQTREMGRLIPEDLETDVSVEELFVRYSDGVRHGLFTILNFQRPDEKTAVISFQNVAGLSGDGAELIYNVNEDGTVIYKETGMSWIR